MKKFTIAIVLMLVVLGIWQCKSAQESTEVTTAQLTKFVKDWEVALKERKLDQIHPFYLHSYIVPPVAAFGKEISYEFDEAAMQVIPVDEGLYDLVVPYQINSDPQYAVSRNGTVKLSLAYDDTRQLKIAQELGTFDKHLWDVAKEVEVKAEEIRKQREARLAAEAAAVTDDTYPHIIDTLLKTYDHVLFYTRIDSNVLFWVANGEWKYSYLFDWGEEQHYATRMGVVDSTGKVIVPLEFETVYNPSGTVPGGIIAERPNGQKMLYNYKGSQMLEYDCTELYPSEMEGVLAHVQSGSSFGLLYEDLRSEYPGPQTSHEARWINPIKDFPKDKWNFDIDDTGWVYLIEPGENSGQHDPIEGRGCIFTPSYLRTLGIYPRAYASIITPGQKGADFGLDRSWAKIKAKKASSDGLLVTFVSDFFEEGLDARGYVYEATKLATVNSVGDTTATLEFNWPERWVNCGGLAYTFLGDTLEVTVTQGGAQVGKYTQFPERLYYVINAQGQFQPLTTDRDFAMTKFREITAADFEGCFAESVESEDYGKVLLTNHLTNDDLDIMRNEIFADYGYKFKKKKWQEYFGAKKWYTGEFDNVDDQLTPLDRKNLEFILEFQKEFKKIESEVIEVDTSYYAAYG